MPTPTEKLRNVAIIGGQGTGKTSLVEAFLCQAKLINKMGSVAQGNTLSDYDRMEKKRGFSINPSLFHLPWRDHKINLLDGPGFTDFVPKTRALLRVAETALLVVTPSTLTSSETRKAWQYAEEEKVFPLIFLNKIDEETVDFSELTSIIEKELSTSCLPLQIPITSGKAFLGVVDLISVRGRGYEEGKAKEVEIPKDLEEEVEKSRKKLLEAVAETDDTLIEKYLETEELTEVEIKKGLRGGIVTRAFTPLLFGSATKNVGIDLLLDTIVDFLPSPKLKESAEKESPSAFVFQTLLEAHLGEVNLFKVFSGVLSSGTTIYNSTKRTDEKIGQIYLMQGSSREETPRVVAGDIGAVAKLKNTETGDILCTRENPVTFPPLQFPEPTTSIALKPKGEKDEKKMSMALAKLVKGDPLLKVETDRESGQTILSGTGEVHLEIMIDRLKTEFNVEVQTEEPKVPYRETITVSAEAQGRYKRQTGGHGQYGDVWLRVRPLPPGEGFKFVNKIKGGAVPSRYIPAVEKGVKEALKKGILASYPLVDLEVTLFDGTYHPVDSSDIAFHIAASMGLKKAVEQAKPILLEPIVELEVEVPDEFLGDANGDLNSRRGKILEVEPSQGRQRIRATVPLAKLHNYSTTLRSITQGKGTFAKRFSHYERTPDEVAQRIIAQAKKSD
ncbi:MAG: elongation factor G [bacterium]